MNKSSDNQLRFCTNYRYLSFRTLREESISDFSSLRSLEMTIRRDIMYNCQKILCVAIAAIATIAATAQSHIHISPQGNDSDKGTKDAPMRTLQAGINMAISTTATDTAYIEVAAGDYYMESVCRITAPNNRPIVVRGAGGKARFIGGKRITNWEYKSGNRYKAHIACCADEAFTFEQLYIDGRRATLARTPNKGFYKAGKVTETITDKGKSTKESYATVRIEGKELTALEHVWPGENGQPKASFYHKWSNSKMHIDVINKANSSFSIGGRQLPPLNSITEGTPYFIYDYAHALDSAGEWYMDYNSCYLTYIPRKGEKLENSECFIPCNTKWLDISGNENGYIENITFEGITFIVSKFSLPRTGYYPSQAAANTGAAIELNFTKGIVFKECTFAHTGAYAVWLREQCHNTTIQGCYMHDLGAGGIKIGLTAYHGGAVTSSNIIDNNIIRSGGREIAEGVGVAIHHSAGNKVTHNDISDFSYSGISVGWKWGYGSSPAVDNTIAYNHIHNIGKGELSDLGGIYTLGAGTGNSIIGNVIHDIEAASYGGWGIYTDEGSSHIEIRNNLVYRCHDGAFHQHYGRENRVENNIFAFGNNCQIQTSRAEEHSSFTFRRNIILQNSGATAKGKWFTANMEIADNIYWSYGDTLSFCGKSSEEWKEQREKSARYINPQMKDPLADDFSFKKMSAARKIGFVPFDYNKAGVYGSEEWRRKTLPHLLAQ